jgi:hypothetical protein
MLTNKPGDNFASQFVQIYNKGTESDKAQIKQTVQFMGHGVSVSSRTELVNTIRNIYGNTLVKFSHDTKENSSALLEHLSAVEQHLENMGDSELAKAYQLALVQLGFSKQSVSEIRSVVKELTQSIFEEGKEPSELTRTGIKKDSTAASNFIRHLEKNPQLIAGLKSIAKELKNYEDEFAKIGTKLPTSISELKQTLGDVVANLFNADTDGIDTLMDRLERPMRDDQKSERFQSLETDKRTIEDEKKSVTISKDDLAKIAKRWISATQDRQVNSSKLGEKQTAQMDKILEDPQKTLKSMKKELTSKLSYYSVDKYPATMLNKAEENAKKDSEFLGSPSKLSTNEKAKIASDAKAKAETKTLELNEVLGDINKMLQVLGKKHESPDQIPTEAPSSPNIGHVGID